MIADVEAERQVLGGMLSSEDIVGDVGELLVTDDFSHPKHRRVFDAIVGLFTAGESVNGTSVGERLGDASKPFLGDLLAEFATPSSAMSAAHVVRRKATARDLVRVGERVKEMGMQGDLEAQDKAEQAIFEVADRRVRGNVRFLDDVVREASEQLDRGDDPGIPTGFVALDETIGGLKPGQLVLVAARPAVGKSCLLTDISLSAARTGVPAVLFSLEMTAREIGKRLLRSQARVSSRHLSEVDWQAITKAQERLGTVPFAVSDSTPLTLMELRAKCRRLKARKGLGLIAVDYLQLMEPPSGDNREQQIASLSRGLKLLAKDLNVPVICATQLNRAAEKRDDKRPRLGDLRESGAQEQDADVVLMLHRPGMNDSTIDSSVTDVIIAKNRNGPTGMRRLRFVPELTHFQNHLESA